MTQAAPGYLVCGSSPRGRGKLNVGLVGPVIVRLIPARAGKASHDPAHPSANTAHPRAGGENAWRSLSSGWHPGSSPRGRGKPEGAHSPGRILGLIPARAGKTRHELRRGHHGRAHPRAGGENFSSILSRCALLGSSPRGRGKRRIPGHPDHRPRLIPALAGKTHQRTWSHQRRSAHPRAGGENVRRRNGAPPQ